MKKGTAGEKNRQAFWVGLVLLLIGTLSFFTGQGKNRSGSAMRYIPTNLQMDLSRTGPVPVWING
nr:hypothetical protein [uncultured Acetatifactor sp.]